MPRQPKGRPTIYRGKDNQYHCWPTVGVYENGRTKRKHIKRRTASEVLEALDDLMVRYNKGQDVTAKVDDFSHWYDHWTEKIIMRRVRMGERAQNTYDDYESIGRVHLKPNLGHYKLVGRKNRLEPEHFEELYASLAERGLSPSYIKRIHVIARRSLREAYRRGKADRIVTELFDAPEFRAVKIKALKLGDAQAVLTEAVADNDELAARWVLGILNGPRQGEVLGLHWTDVELDPADADEVPHVRPTTQIQRQKWRHGCDDPAWCVRNRRDSQDRPKNPCRPRRCPPKYKHGCKNPNGCKKFAHFCPEREIMRNDLGSPMCCTHTRLAHCKPCPGDCVGHASTCPDRRDGGLVETKLKTEGSEAPMALPKVLVEMLRKQRERQIKRFAEAGMEEWSRDVHCFTDKRGKPIDPRRDWGSWKLLLQRAQVNHTRLHAARHTTGTYLRATGADMKMIKEVLRHVDPNISGVYTEEGMDAKRIAVERVAAALMDGDLSMILGARRVA